jgi:hypothetical protein
MGKGPIRQLCADFVPQPRATNDSQAQLALELGATESVVSGRAVRMPAPRETGQPTHTTISLKWWGRGMVLRPTWTPPFPRPLVETLAKQAVHG